MNLLKKNVSKNQEQGYPSLRNRSIQDRFSKKNLLIVIHLKRIE